MMALVVVALLGLSGCSTKYMDGSPAEPIEDKCNPKGDCNVGKQV
jgi:hypothetical protein